MPSGGAAERARTRMVGQSTETWQRAEWRCAEPKRRQTSDKKQAGRRRVLNLGVIELQYDCCGYQSWAGTTIQECRRC